MKVPLRAIFPDTNTLLHYPPIKDVDWRAVGNAEMVKIVLCMPVIDELDEKKGHSQLSDRAKRVLKEIDAIEEAGNRIRDGVSLEIYKHEFRVNDFPDLLKPTIIDEQIIRLVLMYMKEADHPPAAIYTEDRGMRVRCKGHGVIALRPDETTRLPNPQTEQERRHRATREELDSLKAKSPNLNLIVKNGLDASLQPSHGAIRRYLQPKPDDVEEAAQQERQRLLDNGYVMHADVLAYLDRFRSWIHERNECFRSLGPLFPFHLIVQNDGISPADDVEVVIRFPSCLNFIAYNNEKIGEMCPGIPSQPDVPKRAKTFADMLRSDRVIMPVEFIRDRTDPVVKLSGDATAGFEINLRLPKLNHHKSKTLGNFHSMISRSSMSRTLNLDVAIIAANMPKKITLAIPLEIDADGRSV